MKTKTKAVDSELHVFYKDCEAGQVELLIWLDRLGRPLGGWLHNGAAMPQPNDFTVSQPLGANNDIVIDVAAAINGGITKSPEYGFYMEGCLPNGDFDTTGLGFGAAA